MVTTIVQITCVGCLTLAELGRRGLLLPSRLPDGLYFYFVLFYYCCVIVVITLCNCCVMCMLLLLLFLSLKMYELE